MQVLNWLAAFSPDEEGGITRLLYTEGWLETQQALGGENGRLRPSRRSLIMSATYLENYKARIWMRLLL